MRVFKNVWDQLFFAATIAAVGVALWFAYPSPVKPRLIRAEMERLHQVTGKPFNEHVSTDIIQEDPEYEKNGEHP